jgi:hypothetical protein
MHKNNVRFRARREPRVAPAPLLFAGHEPNNRERPSIVRPAEPSHAAATGVDGTPIMAWHDLIANLGTLTLNEVGLPMAPGENLHMLARPTELQQQVFALWGVPTSRGQ